MTPGKPAMTTESDEAMMTNLARIAQAYRTHSPSLFSFYTSYITSVQLADILIFLSSSEAGYKPPKDSEKKIDPDMLQAILNMYLPRKVVQPSGARIRNRYCKPSITSGFPWFQNTNRQYTSLLWIIWPTNRWYDDATRSPSFLNFKYGISAVVALASFRISEGLFAEGWEIGERGTAREEVESKIGRMMGRVAEGWMERGKAEVIRVMRIYYQNAEDSTPPIIKQSLQSTTAPTSSSPFPTSFSFNSSSLPHSPFQLPYFGPLLSTPRFSSFEQKLNLGTCYQVWDDDEVLGF